MSESNSIDCRSRTDADQMPFEIDAFFGDELLSRLDEHQSLIAPGAPALGLAELSIEVADDAWTLRWDGDRVHLASGRSAGNRFRLDAQDWTDIVHDQITPMALITAGLVDMSQLGMDQLMNWWVVLRAALDGRPVPTNADIAVKAAHRSFEPDDDPSDMRGFLEDAGYLHIRGVFTPEEMSVIEADYATAAENFAEGDFLGIRAATADGERHLVRMIAFERFSAAMRELKADPRIAQIAAMTGCDLVPPSPTVALDKPVGIVNGIADTPWHKDCSLGRHSYQCCSPVVGFYVTDADADHGHLRVAPGTHRALVWSPDQRGLDLETRDLAARAGDISVHLSCTLHMAVPPTTTPRKVVYTRLDHIDPDPEAAQAGRARLNALRAGARVGGLSAKD
ncbi:MAG: phytanoyl-CoA dioxygenase family protein [Acidimicrobiales bacterium]|nr:phytanoyl-CoA dioxygenase family protein [Acidimicrobiales bacterium]